jgi:hypothetical protein
MAVSAHTKRFIQPCVCKIKSIYPRQSTLETDTIGVTWQFTCKTILSRKNQTYSNDAEMQEPG